mmetsp:Transcript_25255/g.58850  ORF Transcript_25255/g.58850 Transcript_25255/m.58850 type:complete len:147 (-) Transcript_25255:80-520(-)|eukprot:CAMPEP_0171101644 /NCGR_PEP_ID=MMETSP0766_2-20121228/55616_1 /TAXON_ID=439317 /ORGANISM="Gambierdiscus australes, Strain CAWD 149" /LENGTH=146 /DNA_ID=CAMNT_0011561755 /DNA_START=141 /DNA_END=581 /DNA_ORIENTATION=+
MQVAELSPGLLEHYMSFFELSKEQVLEQKAAFDVLDANGDGDITFQELTAVNAKYAEGFSEKELQEQFSELDVDGSGHVTFQEFLAVYVKGEFGREVPLVKVQVHEERENVIQHINSECLEKKRRASSRLEAIADDERLDASELLA